jgi:shikimate kinase
MAQLLVNHRDIAAAGTVSNQGRFYDRFEHVVLLSAPVEVLLDRVGTRTTNPYGREPGERAEIVRYVATVEPMLRRTATVELDAHGQPAELADISEPRVTRAVTLGAGVQPPGTLARNVPPPIAHLRGRRCSAQIDASH